MLKDIADAATWLALVAGILSLAIGILTLARQSVALPWKRGRVRWQPWGWAQVLLGVFIILNAGPRLASASAGLALGLSVVALAPLVAFCALMMRSDIRFHESGP